MIQRISLYKEFGNNILTRSSIVSLFKKNINVSKYEDVIVDFKNIKFISRSCTSEYLKLREETNKNLVEKNMSNEIRAMFDLVIKQLKSVDFTFTKKIPVREITA